MQDSIPAIVVGCLSVATGACLMAAHVRAWRKAAADPDLEDADRRHYRHRFRRRMQTSGLIALIGVAIPLGDALPMLRKTPLLFAFYWLGVLLLVAWVILMGVGDLFSVRSHSRASLENLRTQQRALEREAERLRRRQSSNGHGPQT